jgi:hypothetical protein
MEGGDIIKNKKKVLNEFREKKKHSESSKTIEEESKREQKCS